MCVWLIDFACYGQPQKAGLAGLLIPDLLYLYLFEFVDSFNLCQGGCLLIRCQGHIPRLAKVFLTICENPQDKGLLQDQWVCPWSPDSQSEPEVRDIYLLRLR